MKRVLFLVCAAASATMAFQPLGPHATTASQRKVPLPSSSTIITITTKSTTTSTTTRLWSIPKPLANEGDWTAYLDEESTGLIYYFNGKTGESRWEPPTESFPIVNLPEDMRRKAEVKRLAYIRSVQEQERQQEKEETKTTTTKTQRASEESTKIGAKEEKTSENWFDFLFEDDSSSSSSSSSTTTEEAPAVEEKEEPAKEEEPNWFSSFFKAAAETASEAAETLKEEVATTATKATTTAAVPTEKEEKKKIEVVEPEVAPIKLEMATCVLPHPQKVFWGGEDAVFTVGRTFGVFDGVSGARKLDGIPLYSKTLAAEMKKRCKDDGGLSVQDLQKYLQEAREIADENSTGASTALIASITEDGFLRALNVGDSTCIVIRDGRVVSKTKEISHFFECPYQLSVDSPDKPRDGTKLNIELVRGDLIVMGSDGVFDNLSDQEILDAIAKGNTNRLGQVAKRIADRSRKVSLNKNAETPYAKQAKKNGDPDYENGLGGKVDDVSCVVVRYA